MVESNKLSGFMVQSGNFKTLGKLLFLSNCTFKIVLLKIPIVGLLAALATLLEGHNGVLSSLRPLKWMHLCSLHKVCFSSYLLKKQ